MPETRLWHVTLTMEGVDWPIDEVREALERLAAEQPFLLSGRYAEDSAEVRYWEEAEDCADACALALRLWGEHRDSARLPHWRVAALEVVERSVQEQRHAQPPLATVSMAAVHSEGAWRPL